MTHSIEYRFFAAAEDLDGAGAWLRDDLEWLTPAAGVRCSCGWLAVEPEDNGRRDSAEVVVLIRAGDHLGWVAQGLRGAGIVGAEPSTGEKP